MPRPISKASAKRLVYAGIAHSFSRSSGWDYSDFLGRTEADAATLIAALDEVVAELEAKAGAGMRGPLSCRRLAPFTVTRDSTAHLPADVGALLDVTQMTSPASRVRRTSGAELVERADGRLAVRKTVYLSPRVEHRLAAYAQGHQLAMSDVVEAALLAYLPAKGAK